MTAKGPGAVCYAVGNGQTNQVPISDKAGALNCMHDQQACLSVGEKDTEMVLRRFTPTECGRLQGMPDWWVSNLEMSNPKDEDIEFWRKVFSEYAQATGGKVKSEAQIRRFLRNPRSDAAEYKMWGNGIALPCAMYVMEGIADLLRN